MPNSPELQAGADTEDAHLEIVGTGKGSFHIALFPDAADNLYGFAPT